MSRQAVGIFQRMKKGQKDMVSLNNDVANALIRLRKDTELVIVIVDRIRNGKTMINDRYALSQEDLYLLNDVMELVRKNIALERKLEEMMGVPYEGLHP